MNSHQAPPVDHIFQNVYDIRNSPNQSWSGEFRKEEEKWRRINLYYRAIPNFFETLGEVLLDSFIIAKKDMQENKQTSTMHAQN